MSLLTIVIPCKNEEKYIGNLLKTLSEQLVGVPIIISDANSTDSTLSIIKSYKNKLDIKVIKGGLPAIGRNNGGFMSKTKYTLFLDADAEIYDDSLIPRALEKMEQNNFDLLTSKLNSHNIIVKFLYKITNIITILSKFDKPFCTGMFFMIRTDVFKTLNGFPEDVLHCEDYLLSKKIDRKKFGIVNGDVYSDNRRFKKMGYFGMIKYIFKNIINRNDYNYFKKDINYWK